MSQLPVVHSRLWVTGKEPQGRYGALRVPRDDDAGIQPGLLDGDAWNWCEERRHQGHLWVARSQTRTVPSKAPLTIWVLSAQTATEATQPLWPVRTRKRAWFVLAVVHRGLELGSGKLAYQSSCPTGEITVLRARGEMHREGGLACPWPAKKPANPQGPALPLTWDQLYPFAFCLIADITALII